MRSAVIVITMIFASLSATFAEEDHALFTGVLQDVVHADGMVDYDSVCTDPRFDDYINYLSSSNPDTILNRDDALAFWINVYNAFMIDAVCREYPIESVNDLHFGGRIIGHILGKTVWDAEFFRISGEKMSLNRVEHEIIRELFDEPRIHFAVNCASMSCPQLRDRAFEGNRLDSQLNDQAQHFLNDSTKNWYDLENRVAHLSKIFDWYGGDFGNSDAAVLRSIAPWLPQEIAAAIRDDADAWEIEYTDYSWKLNDASR